MELGHLLGWIGLRFLEIPLRDHYKVGWDEALWGGGRATRAWRGQQVYKGGVHVFACCVSSPPFYKWMLFLPLTFHCCKDAVSSEPHHRPLWRTRSSFTSACPSLLRNQRFPQMSSWGKWEPFAAVMAPKNGLCTLVSCALLFYFSFVFLNFYVLFVCTKHMKRFQSDIRASSLSCTTAQ